MELYEVDQRIAELLENTIDPETGEVKDEAGLAEFSQLQMIREQKIEQLALIYKNLASDIEAIKAERKALAERMAVLDKKAESAKKILSYTLNGEKFSTPRVQITFRKSQVTVAGPDFVKWAIDNNADDLLTYKTPTANLVAIKKAIKDGRKLEHASVEANYSMTIK